MEPILSEIVIHHPEDSIWKNGKKRYETILKNGISYYQEYYENGNTRLKRNLENNFKYHIK